ncbi:MAG: hypothetical protein MUP55_05085 [Candidatus Aenigmarchaeota archaeon]|nr:hypothetical protein [Candidatus Aenigmarchaeota archaeon]
MVEEVLKRDLNPGKALLLIKAYNDAGFIMTDRIESHGVCHIVVGNTAAAYITPSEAGLVNKGDEFLEPYHSKIKRITLELGF